ncbi:hypothetical protein BDZ89DRAFT_1059658 [Hymenopellis radicata]|nr:hypothetical protein BDZ89DRAFT_1059658 [Hymenopellis radicata]
MSVDLIDLSHTTPPASLHPDSFPSTLDRIRARNERLAAGLSPLQVEMPVILNFPNSIFTDDPENESFHFTDRYGLCIVGYDQASESCQILFDIRNHKASVADITRFPQYAHSAETPSTWKRLWDAWNSNVRPTEIAARFPTVSLTTDTVDFDELMKPDFVLVTPSHFPITIPAGSFDLNVDWQGELINYRDDDHLMGEPSDFAADPQGSVPMAEPPAASGPRPAGPPPVWDSTSSIHIDEPRPTKPLPTKFPKAPASVADSVTTTRTSATTMLPLADDVRAIMESTRSSDESALFFDLLLNAARDQKKHREFVERKKAERLNKKRQREEDARLEKIVQARLAEERRAEVSARRRAELDADFEKRKNASIDKWQEQIRANHKLNQKEKAAAEAKFARAGTTYKPKDKGKARA